MSQDAFAKRLLEWFDRDGRHDLPWQKRISPYRVWVSEIMLQQTQVATVIPYFERFTRSFPSVNKLAGAPADDVLHHWSGLGYYARARNLHKAAKIIAREHGGRCPQDLASWLALPGVGRSTAGAILALSKNQRHPILDGNVKRVLARYHGVAGWPGQSATLAELWDKAERHTPHERVAGYTQAIMDLGATLCTRTSPNCEACPQKRGCHARQHAAQDRFPGKRPKKDKPVRTRTMLVVKEPGGSVLLTKRPPSGIWGGLWSLPELDDNEAPKSWCERHLASEVQSESRWPALRHTFTHFHLDITPICIELADTTPRGVEEGRFVWYNRSAPPAVGLAAPVKKLLESPPRGEP